VSGDSAGDVTAAVVVKVAPYGGSSEKDGYCRVAGGEQGAGKRLREQVTAAAPEWTPPPDGDLPLLEALVQFWPCPASGGVPR
jgi:hypothetical protein